ncbi:Mizu-kussei [Thalictrum thalictroides]|uniref:Mizu-kussei n=1 Tax=Thalictrum thalictroides TaxID=46969 RepID=A0A7J6W9G0_THATH|nr:Mizu-kussei [Thalictrum thalictroides]
MSSIMDRTPHESSFSFSKRYFQLRKKNEEEKSLHSFSSSCLGEEDNEFDVKVPMQVVPASKKKLSAKAVSRFRSVFGKHKSSLSSGLGTRVACTLFGYRRGHVNFAFQDDPNSYTAFFIELPIPTSSLIREMASGLVRIALECDKVETKGVKLLEEALWRTYCNGKKCGIAIRQDVGTEELKVLKAVGPISMGAGVLPGSGSKSDGELMYMRAKFERVVGSKHTEAFYMMNPDGTGGPELSIYLSRV